MFFPSCKRLLLTAATAGFDAAARALSDGAHLLAIASWTAVGCATMASSAARRS